MKASGEARYKERQIIGHGGSSLPELNYPDVSANSIVMAVLGGGHAEKHKIF
jgi:hypothetical protein